MGRRPVTILDTHAWIWWTADRAQLSRKAKNAIENDRRLGVCDISLWEVAMLVAKGRLRIDRDVREWLDQAASLPRIEIVQIRPAIAVRSTQLGRDFQGDPADRLIVATAITETARLVTKDERIRSYPAVTAVW